MTAKIIDGAAAVQMKAPRQVKTFGEYSLNIFRKSIITEIDANGFTRIDVVFDRYMDGSLKSETRERRGKGVRISVQKNTPIWANWQQFLREDENKTELFRLLAKDLTMSTLPGCIVVTTDLEGVTCSATIDANSLSPCNHEEADTRIFLHAKHIVECGHRKVVIQTVDTDVVIIGISLFGQINAEELWIEFGVGKSKRWLPIHRYAASLGDEMCQGLLFWFSFTGCDTVSAFCGRGKKMAWNTWNIFPDITETFIR